MPYNKVKYLEHGHKKYEKNEKCECCRKIRKGGMKNMTDVNSRIGKNLVSLRKKYHMTQEEVAERIGVSRQAIAKWEKGESIPDLNNSMAMAELFEVTLDGLVSESQRGLGFEPAPKGKYFFGAVTVGERGQIVIPKKARNIFSIEQGDQLLVFGDEERGIGIVPKRTVHELLKIVGSHMFDSQDEISGNLADRNQTDRRNPTRGNRQSNDNTEEDDSNE